MRVLVCGGRDYSDKTAVYGALDGIWRTVPHDSMVVIQGGASGADAFARQWCVERFVEYINVPAEWNVHGLKAGPIRNQKMIDRHQPQLVLAFPGGKGTADMVRRAKAANIKIVEFGAA